MDAAQNTLFIEYLFVNMISFFITLKIIKENISFKKILIFLSLLITLSFIPVLLDKQNIFPIYTIIYLISLINLRISLNLKLRKILLPFLVAQAANRIIINIIILIVAEYTNFDIINSFFIMVLIYVLSFVSTLKIIDLVNKFDDKCLTMLNTDIVEVFSYYLIVTYNVLLNIISVYFSAVYTFISGKTISTEYVIISCFFLIFAAISLILTQILLEYIYNKFYSDIENRSLKEDLENLELLNKDLRSQRHDFANHLQVILGLIQLKKYTDCFNYVFGLNQYNKNLGSIKTSIITLNALLNKKQSESLSKNIRFEIVSSCDFNDFDINIESWELVRILGNIIDNAIYEELKVTTFDKLIKISMQEDAENYIFTVYNKNSYIPSERQISIFNPGYTTKGSKGYGMGLYIVKSIVNKYNGKIDLTSGVGTGTSFSIIFPKPAKMLDVKSTTLQSYPPQNAQNTQSQ